MSGDDADRRLFAQASVVRVWRTGIDPDRSSEYRQFVRTTSVPMFRRQAGFMAALFCGQGGERLVITLWRDRPAVDALNTPETYRATVEEIQAVGFLDGAQVTDVFDLHSHIV